VELDVEYRDLAKRLGVPGYFRVADAEQRSGVLSRRWPALVRRAMGLWGGVVQRGRGAGFCPAGVWRMSVWSDGAEVRRRGVKPRRAERWIRRLA